MERIKTNYNKIENVEKNGIELYFESIPTTEERNILKENGYKWNNAKKCWYIKKDKIKEPIKTGIKEATRFNYTSNAWEGVNYQSGLSLKEIAKIIKNELKRKYPEATFSITTEYYSGGQSLHISLMKSTKNPFNTFEKAIEEADGKGESYNRIYSHPERWHALSEYEIQKSEENKKYLKARLERGHIQVNQYNIKDDYELSEYGKKIMTDARSLADSFNFDDSDGMIDYFHTNFYLHLNIGKWDKKFELLEVA
jgi:hypothetical protein